MRGSLCVCAQRRMCSTSALLDHLIVGDSDRYYSFNESGSMGAAPDDRTSLSFDVRILWKRSTASRLRSLRSPLARP